MLDFELAINAVKLAISPEARQSAAALRDLLLSTPEWQKDICTLQASIDPQDTERSVLLRDIIETKLFELEFTPECCEAFCTSYIELYANVIAHGLPDRRDKSPKIRMSFDMSPSYVSVTMHNPNKKPIKLNHLMGAALTGFRRNMYAKRGRGLLMIHELSDSFASTDNGAVKAVFYRDRVDLGLAQTQDITIISIISGHKNPSLARRLLAQIQEVSSTKLIVDLGGPIQTKNNGLRRFGRIIYRSSQSKTAPTTSIGDIIPLFDGRDLLWRIVCPHSALRRLLPQQIVHSSLEDAIRDLQ